MILVVVKCWVFFAVRTELLNIISTSFGFKGSEQKRFFVHTKVTCCDCANPAAAVYSMSVMIHVIGTWRITIGANNCLPRPDTHHRSYTWFTTTHGNGARGNNSGGFACCTWDVFSDPKTMVQSLDSTLHFVRANMNAKVLCHVHPSHKKRLSSRSGTLEKIIRQNLLFTLQFGWRLLI
jgi:hypothetical protein